MRVPPSRRWAELRGRLEVVPTRGEAGAGNLSERLTTLGDLREVRAGRRGAIVVWVQVQVARVKAGRVGSGVGPPICDWCWVCACVCVCVLAQFGVQQTAVFGVGDRHQAVTLTANGAAVRTAQQQGVAVEAVVHRPVWLTGL